MKKLKKRGDVNSFDKNWTTREESTHTYWTRNNVENQIQLAFRNHWLLFDELINSEKEYNGKKRVLEVGCGRGSLSCYFSDAGYDCTLVDLSSNVISIAKKIFSKNKLEAKFFVGDANNLDFPDNSFDIVYSIGLLEHFDSIDAPLVEQIRVLDNGGMWFGYIVPEYTKNIQTEYEWINLILQGYTDQLNHEEKKEGVFRSDYGSERYIPILERLGLRNIKVSGVYPVPMISHSTDFPFSLMPEDSEKVLVKYLEELLRKNLEKTGKNQWLCDEGYGNAFLIWGVK